MTDIRDQLRRSQRVRQSSRSEGKPYLAEVTGVQADADFLNTTSHVGDIPVKVAHPYVGANSWIRAVPENKTQVLISKREAGPVSHIGYVSDFSPAKAKDYEGKNNLWRRMNQGEMDIASVGAATTYWGRRGNLEWHGGCISGGLSNDKLESYWFAPLHRRVGYEKSVLLPLSLGADEERFGVVKRAHPLFPMSQELFIPTVNALGPTYAKEWLMGLFNLIYHREGDVVDDLGLPEISAATGVPLRAAHRWKTTNIATYSSFEVDAIGNVAWTLAPEALIGFQITVPTSDFSVLAAKQISLMAGINATISAATLASIDAPQIKLGSAAVDAVIKGTPFMAGMATMFDSSPNSLKAVLTSLEAACTADATAFGLLSTDPGLVAIMLDPLTQPALVAASTASTATAGILGAYLAVLSTFTSSLSGQLSTIVTTV